LVSQKFNFFLVNIIKYFLIYFFARLNYAIRKIDCQFGKKLDPNREFEFYYREMMADGKWQKFKESRKQKPCGDCGGSGKKQPKSQEYRDGFKDGVADYRKERDDKAGYQDGFTEQNDANLDDNRVNKDVQPDQNRTDAYQEGFERGKQDANKRDQQRGYDDGYDQQQQAGDEGQLPPENKSESYQDGFNQGAQDARDGKPKQEQSQQGDDQQSQQGQCDQSGDQQSGDQGQQSGSQGQNGQQPNGQQGQNQPGQNGSPSNQGQPSQSGQNGQTGQQGQQSQQQGGQGRGDQAEQDYQQGKQDGYNAAKQAAEGKGQQGQDGQGQQGQGEGEGDSQGEGQQGHGEGGEGHGQGQGEPCPCCNGTGREGGAGGQPSPGQGMTAEELQQYMDMIRDSHGSWEESDDSQQMENFDDILREIVERAENKSRGTVPGHYQSLIEQLYQQPEVPWQKIFSQMVGAVKIPYRKTRLRKNRRQPQRNDLLGRLPDKTVKVCAAYDTSGSVSDEELKWGFNELFDILKCVKSDVTIIETDYHVQRTYQAKKASDVDLKPKGRGGTAFTPTFQWIKENNQKFDVIIYFTDGEGESRIEADRCGNPKVIWVVTRCKGDKAAREHLSCSDDKRFCHHVKGLYPGVTSSREK
jgi:hypothetical protein